MKQDVPNRFYSMGFEAGRERGRLDNKGQVAYLTQQLKLKEKQTKIKELEMVYDILLGDGNPANKTKKYIQDKLLRLKDGEE